MFYYQYLKRGRLRVRYHPKLSDEFHIARGSKFEGRIEALNIGNVSTLILSVSILNPQFFSEVKLEDEFGRSFPIRLAPGEPALIRYSLDVKSKPIMLETGFIIISSEKTYKRRFKLIFE
jgi:hypothetical protein